MNQQMASGFMLFSMLNLMQDTLDGLIGSPI